MCNWIGNIYMKLELVHTKYRTTIVLGMKINLLLVLAYA